MHKGILAKREAEARMKVNAAAECLADTLLPDHSLVAALKTATAKDKEIAVMLQLEAMGDLLEALNLEAERKFLLPDPPPPPPTKAQVVAILLGEGGVAGLSGVAIARIEAWAATEA